MKFVKGMTVEKALKNGYQVKFNGPFEIILKKKTKWLVFLKTIPLFNS